MKISVGSSLLDELIKKQRRPTDYRAIYTKSIITKFLVELGSVR